MACVQAGDDLSLQDKNGEPFLHPITRRLKSDTLAILLQMSKIDASAVNRHGETVLHLLLKERLHNDDIFELFLKHGADANISRSDGVLPLHLATCKDDSNARIELLNILIKKTDDINSADQLGFTAAHWACEQGNLQGLKVLVDNGAKLNVHDKYGYTPLHRSILCRHKEEHNSILEALVEGGAAINETKHSTDKCDQYSGLAPLHLAIVKTRVDSAWTLIEREADVNKRTPAGYLPIHLASERADMEESRVVTWRDPSGEERWCVEHKKIKDLIEPLIKRTEINSVDSLRRTPLYIAVINHIYNLVPVLLEHDADANISNSGRWLPLHQMFSSDPSRMGGEVKFRALKMLVSHTKDINAQSPDNKTILHYAVEAEDCGAIKLLLENGAEIDIRNNSDQTASQLAASQCLTEPLRVLLEKVDDASCRNARGQTLLHLCVMNSHRTESGLKGTVNLLTDHIQIDVQDNDGYTPLHTAIQAGASDAVDILMRESQSIEILSQVTKTGDSVLHIAAAKNKKDILKKLVQSGAKLAQRNILQESALHTAAIKGLMEISEYLIEAGLSVDDIDSASHTVLDIAVIHGQQEMTTMLLNRKKEPGSIQEVVEKTNKQLLQHVKSETSKTAAPLIGAWYRAMIESNIEFDLMSFILENPLESVEKDSEDYSFCPVQPVQDDVIRDRLAQMKKNSIYKMSSKPRGRAIILNVMNFHGKPGKKRTGSDIDVRRLTLLFKQLGFVVFQWIDLTAKELRGKIEEEKKCEEHKTCDAFVMVAMSHGSADNLKMTDGEMIDIEKDIITPFDGESWPVMAGKPKVFLFQCCRGEGASQAVAASPSQPASPFFSCHSGDRHPKADIIKIFSTYGGESANRDMRSGSWFIREFILAAEAYSHLKHLQDIITQANLLLQHQRSFLTGNFQVAQVDRTLLKELYFLPGWPRTSAADSQA